MNEQAIAKESVRTAKEVVADIAELMKTLVGIIRDEHNENNSNASELYKHIKDGKGIRSLTVADEEQAILKKYIEKEGIPYLMVDVAGDNCKVVMFRDIDEEKINMAVKCMNLELDNVVDLSFDEFNNIYKNEDMFMVNVKDKMEAEFLKDKCIDKGIPHTTIMKDGQYTFIVPKTKADDIGRAVAEMTWEMTGENAKHYNSLIKETMAAYSFSTMSRINMEQMIEEKGGKFFIVDHDNPKNYLKITEKGMELYKNEQLISSDSLSEVERHLAAMKNPIILTQQEMTHKEQVISQKIPDLNTDIEARERKLRNLYLEKVGLMYASYDGNAEMTGAISDPSVSFSEFVQNEVIDVSNDIQDAQVREQAMNHFNNARQTLVRYEYTEETTVLDKVIRDAQSRVAQGVRTEELSRTYTHSTR